jgi:putative transposase
MEVEPNHRKQIKHFHEAGDLHELTFSCSEREALLVKYDWFHLLSQRIERSCEICDTELYAFVFMPEHVHLLVGGINTEDDVSRFLFSIKQPFSMKVKRCLQRHDPALLNRLMVEERPGKHVFRFWLEGPGYDRNLNEGPEIEAAIHYFHRNPVERELCATAVDWKWSSARYYLSDGTVIDPDLPKITKLSFEFYD